MVDGGPAGLSERPADLELVRVCVAPEGCFGVLLAYGIPAGPVTIERTYPLVESRPRSLQFVKIPPGQYRCERTTFWRGGYASYEVMGVAGRSRLLFHVANEETDVDGCIGVGARFGFLRGTPAVLDSREGFQAFMGLVGERPSFSLLIRGVS